VHISCGNASIITYGPRMHRPIKRGPFHQITSPAHQPILDSTLIKDCQRSMYNSFRNPCISVNEMCIESLCRRGPYHHFTCPAHQPILDNTLINDFQRSMRISCRNACISANGPCMESLCRNGPFPNFKCPAHQPISHGTLINISKD
jgi:hypothetical protein